MSISISNESKNSLTITNEDKLSSETWDDADYEWNEATGTWEVPGMVLTRESKNSLTITNESKN